MEKITVELTTDMIMAIKVAFAELETGEWAGFVTDEEDEQVRKGQSALEEIFKQNEK